MRHEVIVEIDAVPARVWEVLFDVESWPSWAPTMRSVRRLDDGPLAAGGAVEIRQPRLPRNVWRVTALDPGSRFEWATSSLGVTTRADHRIEPLPGDRTQVTLTAEITGALAPLVGLLFGSLTRDYVDTEAASLKRHCETARRTGP
jgi:uncharacterized membrane protein